MTYFITADVHSFYPALRTALDAAGFDHTNPNHTLVSLGDLLDRGSYPIDCLKYMLSLDPSRRIFIRGNHEDLIQKAIDRGTCLSHDYSNGTAMTVAELLSSPENMALWNDYYAFTTPFHEIGTNIFVHGWIPTYDPSWRYDWRTGDWSAAAWDNGMLKWHEGYILPEHTIFCGHWHTSWGHHFLHNTSEEWPNPRSTNPDHQKADFSPFIDTGIVALDACTAVSHHVNVYTLEVN